MKYAVTLTTHANTVVDVEVSDDVTDPAVIAELAMQQNAEPTLCHQCGGGRFNGQELIIGDDWSPVLIGGTPSVTRIDA